MPRQLTKVRESSSLKLRPPRRLVDVGGNKSVRMALPLCE